MEDRVSPFGVGVLELMVDIAAAETQPESSRTPNEDNHV